MIVDAHRGSQNGERSHHDGPRVMQAPVEGLLIAVRQPSHDAPLAGLLGFLHVGLNGSRRSAEDNAGQDWREQYRQKQRCE